VKHLSLLLILAATAAAADIPTIDELMRRVAENQEKSSELRKTVVYRQKSFVRLLRTNGKMSREEKREYTVLPSEKGFEKKLEHFEGRYERGGKVLTYDKPNFQYKDTDIDGDLIEDFSGDLMNDKQSRDGISRNLFPLTRDEQRHYTFRLAGTRKVGAVEALRVTFEPIKQEGDERCWRGEALIHPDEFQPMAVTTELSFHIPAAVRLLLGINIKQLGFNVTYKKVDEGLWFPASYGSEFYLKVLFGYKRNITMSMVNEDFRRTEVTSRVTADEPTEAKLDAK